MPQRRIPGRAIIARSVAKVGVQNMKIEQIRETAQKKLFVGKKVKVFEFGKDRHGANARKPAYITPTAMPSGMLCRVTASTIIVVRPSLLFGPSASSLPTCRWGIR